MLPPEVAKAILKKFKGRCAGFCSGANAAITLHHLKPKSGGGTDEEENLIPLCAQCHYWAHLWGTKNTTPTLRKNRTEFLARITNKRT